METVLLVENGQYVMAILYVGISIIGGLGSGACLDFILVGRRWRNDNLELIDDWSWWIFRCCHSVFYFKKLQPSEEHSRRHINCQFSRLLTHRLCFWIGIVSNVDILL